MTLSVALSVYHLNHTVWKSLSPLVYPQIVPTRWKSEDIALVLLPPPRFAIVICLRWRHFGHSLQWRLKWIFENLYIHATFTQIKSHYNTKMWFPTQLVPNTRSGLSLNLMIKSSINCFRSVSVLGSSAPYGKSARKLSFSSTNSINIFSSGSDTSSSPSSVSSSSKPTETEIRWNEMYRNNAECFVHVFVYCICVYNTYSLHNACWKARHIFQHIRCTRTTAAIHHKFAATWLTWS